MGVAGLELGGEPSARAGTPAPDEAAGFGAVLGLWMALTVLIHGGLWLTGFPRSGLAGAVEQGAARAESQGAGEIGDDLIRKAVRTQRDTLPFWTVLAFLGDFLVEPVALAVRALAAATAFSAVAALMGRPAGYDRALADAAKVQGFWVLGLAVRAGLMVALRRPEVETSAALVLPDGSYPAAAWLAARQLDAFALAGWLALARGASRRGQVGVPAALAVCGGFWLAEAALRVGLGLITGAGMRLAVTTG
jgi:hypothetical protein